MTRTKHTHRRARKGRAAKRHYRSGGFRAMAYAGNPNRLQANKIKSAVYRRYTKGAK